MADERLAASLQISVLAALCFDSGHGAAIAAQVNPGHFDDAWRSFVIKVLRYRKEYGRPPGENDIEDLANLASLGHDSKLLKGQLLPELFVEKDGLNAEYAATRVTSLIRHQTLKKALFEAGDRFNNDDENLVADIEDIFHKALSARQVTLNAGIRLDDPRALRFLDKQDEFISLGIPDLDRMRIGLRNKKLLLYVAPKGTGKSWFCVHCGKMALVQRLKVVHYSLEMDEDEVVGRYYQSLFAAAETGERYIRSTLKREEITEKLAGFKVASVFPQLVDAHNKKKGRLVFTNPDIKKILTKKVTSFGARFSNLWVKSFPTSQLTVAQLSAHLDYLAEVERFVPNVLIVDYPKLMHINRATIRTDIGRNVEELRGVAVERNMALVAPHQGTRATIGAKRTKSKDAGEDISVVQTADVCLAYSRTEAEEQRGLGRLSVEHSRTSRGGAMILLAQSYDTGQYVLDSALMQKAYWDQLKQIGGDEEDE